MLYLTLRNPASRKYALSGTCFVNNVKDLYSISTVLFGGAWAENKIWENLQIKAWYNISQSIPTRTRLHNEILVHRSTQWLVDAIQLEPPTRRIIEVTMTGKHWAIYQEFLKQFGDFLRELDGTVDGADIFRKIMARVQLMINVANHPNVITGTEGTAGNASGKLWKKRKWEDGSTWWMGPEDESSKVTAILQEMRELRARNPSAKPLLFSHSSRFLTILVYHLLKADFACLKITGSVSKRERETLLNLWKKADGFTIMLGGIKCIGVGMNLQDGSDVYLLDQSWNAATIEQAEARVWRMGQTKHVTLTTFKTVNSIEDFQMDLVKYKMQSYNIIMNKTQVEREDFLSLQSVINKRKLLMGIDDDSEEIPEDDIEEFSDDSDDEVEEIDDSSEDGDDDSDKNDDIVDDDALEECSGQRCVVKKRNSIFDEVGNFSEIDSSEGEETASPKTYSDVPKKKSINKHPPKPKSKLLETQLSREISTIFSKASKASKKAADDEDIDANDDKEEGDSFSDLTKTMLKNNLSKMLAPKTASTIVNNQQSTPQQPQITIDLRYNDDNTSAPEPKRIKWSQPYLEAMERYKNIKIISSRHNN